MSTRNHELGEPLTEEPIDVPFEMPEPESVPEPAEPEKVPA